MKIRLSITISIVLLFSCSSFRPGGKPESDPGSSSTEVETFDPQSLSDYDFTIEKYEFKTTREDTAVYKFSFLKDDTDTTSIEEEIAPGYRVQIFSSGNISRANEVHLDALAKFGRQVYIEYSAPLYKVRVGNCLSRIEADALQQEVASEGYPDAWVVQTQILILPPEEFMPADSTTIDMQPDTLFEY